jgi:cellulose biosynthesis protein BcsQ
MTPATSAISLQTALRNLPPGAEEPIVESQFIELALLGALGFTSGDFYKQFRTGHGANRVDYALRKTVGDDVFVHTQSKPYLLIEAKGRNVKLQEGSSGCKDAVKQIKEYLNDPNCQTAEWGIITNADHIQLFRKHGKVIFPVTRCLEITLDNIEEVVNKVRQKIEVPPRALTVAIYANKGGVGKTSTTINLSAVLGHGERKKVLVVDLDPNQRDLTNSVNVAPAEHTLSQVLTDRNVDVRSAISPYGIVRKGKTHHFFDVLPADKGLIGADDNALRKLLTLSALKQKLESVTSDYDYIFIDCSPNWTVFSQMAMVAADVVLTPVGFNNLSALRNVAVTVGEHFPSLQKLRDDNGPTHLPIFFNGGKLTDKNRVTVYEAIENILSDFQREKQGTDLREIYFPKFTKAHKNRYIFEIPNFNNIAGAVFAGIPASYQYKPINAQYRDLAKEYFLHEYSH